MKTHVQIVAALHIAFGALSRLAAITVFAFFGMAGTIVLSEGEHEAASRVSIVAVVLALPGIIGDWALFTDRSWGRPFVMMLGVLQLFNIPFGTVLGIYTLWALLHELPKQTLSASTI
jgi:hypothetical protein